MRNISTKWGRFVPGQVAGLILLFAFIQLIIALFTDSLSFSFDEAIWQYIGRNWFRHGLTPYSGGVDNKSPLIFAIFGLSDKLFGLNEWFPRVLGTAFQSLGIFYIFKTGNYLFGRRAGIFAMTIYALSLLWHATGGKYVSYTETYESALLIMAFYFFFSAGKNSQWIWCGFIASWAFAFRITAAWGILAILLVSFLKDKKTLIPVITGLFAGLLSVISLAWIFGINLQDIYIYAFADNFGSGSPTGHGLSWRIQNFLNKMFSSEFVLFIPVLTAYFFLVGRNPVLIIWFIAAFTGLHALGIYSTQHFKELLPPLALISGHWLDEFGKRFATKFQHLMIVVWISFFPKTLEPLRGIKRWLIGPAQLLQGQRPLQEELPDELIKKQLGLWIRSVTREQDQLLVAGYGAVVQAYSERLSPSVYFNETSTARARRRFAEELSYHRPAVIALPAPAEYERSVNPDTRRVIDDLIARNYVLEDLKLGYHIYRIKK